MYSIYQHWDPLKTCIVGRSWPAEWYSHISSSHVRKLFEKIAIETEEDYQAIIKKLQEFGVTVLRPNLLSDLPLKNSFLKPPMTPRDNTVMIGNNLYCTKNAYNFERYYTEVRRPELPLFNVLATAAPGSELADVREKMFRDFLNSDFLDIFGLEYKDIIDHVKQQGNQVHDITMPTVNGAMVSRIGKDLYFGTEHQVNKSFAMSRLQANAQLMFPNYRTHVVNTDGHSDATYCPVCPGLIISLYDIPSYQQTFPGWEVVYLPNQSWGAIPEFIQLKMKNKGKWWIPGFENDQAVIDYVESWLNHWTGYVEETVFDINMLVIDPKNVIVFNYNKTVFDALERYGITPHIVPFRHRYFWDGGIHCVTSDLHREGTMQDYFPQRG